MLDYPNVWSEYITYIHVRCYLKIVWKQILKSPWRGTMNMSTGHVGGTSCANQHINNSVMSTAKSNIYL